MKCWTYPKSQFKYRLNSNKILWKKVNWHLVGWENEATSMAAEISNLEMVSLSSISICNFPLISIPSVQSLMWPSTTWVYMEFDDKKYNEERDVASLYTLQVAAPSTLVNKLASISISISMLVYIHKKKHLCLHGI